MALIMEGLRPQARLAPESGIVEIIKAGRDHPELIPLWAGEGDLPTPAFICEAAKQSLDRGETFYTYQRGVPELRQALAHYHERTFGRPFSPEEFYITGSGMQAIQLALQCVAGDGDEILYPAPAWPNLEAAAGVLGASAIPVPMTIGASGWQLDLDALFDAVTPKTRAIGLNSPCNPTGWTASVEQLSDILQECRKRGLWIIADEVYGRFFFGNGKRAPSFLDIADEDDRIIFVNTFSKNWAMTGWRIGWISAPPVMGQVLENLIQYSTSGVPVFTQRGATAALELGDAFLEEQIERAASGRRQVIDVLRAVPRVTMSEPAGAFYAFFAVDGMPDSRQLALDLVRETGVGLAPGSAFGAAGAGHVRLCFARNAEHVDRALKRIVRWIESK